MLAAAQVGAPPLVGFFCAGFNNISCLRYQNADLSAGFGLLFLQRAIAATDSIADA